MQIAGIYGSILDFRLYLVSLKLSLQHYSLHVVEDQNPGHTPKTLKTSQYAADERLIAHVIVEFRIYPPGVFQPGYKAVSGRPGNLSEWELTSLSPIHLEVLSRQSLKPPDGILLCHLLLLADELHPLVENAVTTFI